MSEPAPEESPLDSSRRKGPTIDLTATEVARAEESDAASQAPHQANTGEDQTASPPEDPSSPQQDNETTPRGRLVPWSAIGAGAVAGAVTAGAIALASLFLIRAPEEANMAARLTRVEQQLHQQSAIPVASDTKAFDELAARIGNLETAVAMLRAPGGDLEAANRISTLEGDLKALSEKLGIAVRRSDEAAAAARDASQRVDAVSGSLAQLQQKLTTALTDSTGTQELANRISSLERAEKALEGELATRADAQSRDAAGRLALAAAALNAALDRGQPFGAELSAVKALGADPKQLAALEPFAGTGIPSASALARELSELIPVLRRAAGASAPEGGFLEKLQANAEKLVRIRSIDAPGGNDPGAIVARVEIDAGKNDLTAATAELSKLPPSVRAPADPWLEKAQRRSAALQAGQQMVVQSLAGLSR